MLEHPWIGREYVGVEVPPGQLADERLSPGRSVANRGDQGRWRQCAELQIGGQPGCLIEIRPITLVVITIDPGEERGEAPGGSRLSTIHHGSRGIRDAFTRVGRDLGGPGFRYRGDRALEPTPIERREDPVGLTSPRTD